MKKIFILATAMATFASCTDLDVDVKSVYTEFPKSEIAQEAIAAECYIAHRDVIANFYKYNGLMSFAGGEQIAVSFNGDYYDGGHSQRATLHNSLPDDNNIAWFDDISGAIVKCNKALLVLSSEDGTMTPTMAQIRAIRAYFHWMLLEGFGDVPIIDRLYDENEAVERAPRKQVTEWVVNELKEVINLLPTDVNLATYGKPTRWMAQALLAKIYLNWNVYTCCDVTTYEPSTPNDKLNDCIAACDEIIKSGKFDLSDDYKSKFLPTNSSKVKDFIYAMPYNSSAQDGMLLGRFHTWRRGQNNGDTKEAGLYSAALTNSTGGCMALNPDFAELFSLPGDRRNDCIYGNDEGGVVYQYGNDYEKTDKPSTYKGETITLSKSVNLKPLIDTEGNEIAIGPAYDHLDCGADIKGWTQGWRSNKFILNPNEYNLNKRNTSNDYPIFRYADILLMKAEAMLRGGTATLGDIPQTLFNQIRDCAKAPKLETAPTLKDMLDERGREFFDEGWRRNDLIRFGEYETPTWIIHQIYPGASKKTNRIFPIPTSTLNSNTNWKQNPGY